MDRSKIMSYIDKSIFKKEDLTSGNLMGLKAFIGLILENKFPYMDDDSETYFEDIEDSIKKEPITVQIDDKDQEFSDLHQMLTAIALSFLKIGRTVGSLTAEDVAQMSDFDLEMEMAEIGL
ncbi:MAG: hypothetical protein K6G22_14230 [Lachnospiraceae bacterium]|nr:hypothetical protein [Lachnospiraceae bacterium]